MNHLPVVLTVMCVVLYLATLRHRWPSINPVSIFLFCFCVPFLVNRLRLSELQAETWSSEAYTLVSYAVLCFGLLPLISLRKIPASGRSVNSVNYFGVGAATALAAMLLLLQLVLNYQLSGVLVPAFHVSSLSGRFHTAEDGGLIATIAIAIWYAGTLLLFVNSSRARSWDHWSIFAAVSLIPLTRLARYDIASIFFACLVYFSLGRSISATAMIRLIAGATAIAVSAAFVAKFRWSGGDADAVSFAQTIEYTGPLGPFEVLPFLYTYYPLSFENIDRIVDPALGSFQLTYGAITAAPLLSGVFKLPYFLSGFPTLESFEKLRDPLHSIATVPTALPAFAMDFGVHFAFIPMTLYSLIGVFLYSRAQSRGKVWTYVFSTYSIGYFQMPFLNHFVQPLTGVILLVMAVAGLAFERALLRIQPPN